MKGDKFRETAARCGDFPTSPLAVPSLEYVGAESAAWESLCLRAAAWANLGPEKGWITEDELVAFGAGPVKARRVHFAVAGLALFARLMAIVTRRRVCGSCEFVYGVGHVESPCKHWTDQ